MFRQRIVVCVSVCVPNPITDWTGHCCSLSGSGSGNSTTAELYYQAAAAVADDDDCTVVQQCTGVDLPASWPTKIKRENKSACVYISLQMLFNLIAAHYS